MKPLLKLKLEAIDNDKAFLAAALQADPDPLPPSSLPLPRVPTASRSPPRPSDPAFPSPSSSQRHAAAAAPDLDSRDRPPALASPHPTPALCPWPAPTPTLEPLPASVPRGSRATPAWPAIRTTALRHPTPALQTPRLDSASIHRQCRTSGRERARRRTRPRRMLSSADDPTMRAEPPRARTTPDERRALSAEQAPSRPGRR
ncbi:hypothetical protein B0H15DRAFT_852225 [Mycena belliarum]|uniref:Uncharacterized protein n=1 Tax=Mycena belliarum TaxID=1033014 RepID=A0AAD6U2I1_9AGAR|nr:hypothetical protein B0H15DRAFT_852225 [Mycena belliae]